MLICGNAKGCMVRKSLETPSLKPIENRLNEFKEQYSA